VIHMGTQGSTILRNSRYEMTISEHVEIECFFRLWTIHGNS